jgi:hypothetical protein
MVEMAVEKPFGIAGFRQQFLSFRRIERPRLDGRIVAEGV